MAVRDQALDLPLELGSADKEEAAARLAAEPGVALLVGASDFENRLLGLTAALDLRATPFPPPVDQESAPSVPTPETWPEGWRVPAEAELLIVTIGEGTPPGPLLIDASLGTQWRGELWETRVRFNLDELGATIDYEFDDEGEAEELAFRELAGRLKATGGSAVVSAPTLANLAGSLAGVPAEVRRFPTEDFDVGIPKDHQQGPEAFAVLGVGAGMGAEAVRLAAGQAFAADEITADGQRVRAARGSCPLPLAAGAGGATEAGSLCLEVELADGTARRIRSRQVLPGNVEEVALKALQERFGRSVFLRETRELPGGDRLHILGWGVALDADRASLARIDGKLPPSVLEAVVWVTEAATTIAVQLDAMRTAAEAEAEATPEIKL